MATNQTKVGLARTGERRQNVFTALDLVRDDITPKLREQVMLKPNFLSSTNQLASTHVDAICGAMDFLLTVPGATQRDYHRRRRQPSIFGRSFREFRLQSFARRICHSDSARRPSSR